MNNSHLDSCLGVMSPMTTSKNMASGRQNGSKFPNYLIKMWIHLNIMILALLCYTFNFNIANIFF